MIPQENSQISSELCVWIFLGLRPTDRRCWAAGRSTLSRATTLSGMRKGPPLRGRHGGHRGLAVPTEFTAQTREQASWCVRGEGLGSKLEEGN